MGTGTAIVEVDAIDPLHPNDTCGGEPAPTAAIETTKLYLQLGAFSTRANADKLANQIASQTTSPISVISVTTEAGYLYKVQIGPIKNVDDVDAITNTLKEKGFGNAFAVVR
jgi:rare lipoprotein A